MLGKIEGGRRRGQQRVRWLDGITDHRLNGHEFEQAPGDGDGQGGLACCSPWGHKESDTTELLNCIESPHVKHPSFPFLKVSAIVSTSICIF